MPPTFTLSDTELELYNWGKGAIPDLLFGDREELAYVYVKIFDAARSAGFFWVDMQYLAYAVGIWLDLKARDFGTFRQGGESDDALRARLQVIRDGVTAAAILAAANAILAADGIAGTATLVEWRPNGKCWCTTGTGRHSGGAFYWGTSWAYRYTRTRWPNGMSLILPYPTTEATAATVAEAARKKKAGGFRLVVERRASP